MRAPRGPLRVQGDSRAGLLSGLVVVSVGQVSVSLSAINSCDVGQAERHVVRYELARSVVSSAWLSFAVGRASQVACVAIPGLGARLSLWRGRQEHSSRLVCTKGDGHSAPRAPPVSGARLVQVKRAAGLACVGPGDRRHSMVGGQVESESLCLSVRRSFLALCLSVSVGVCRSGGRTWSSGSMSSVVILSVWWSCVVGGGLGRAGRRSARLCRWPGSVPCRPGRAC